MLDFIINPYYKNSYISFDAINSAIILSNDVINLYKNNQEFLNIAELIGIGNDAGGKVYSLKNTKFCLKISKLGKHVGRNQEKQFELQNQCLEAFKNRTVGIEGNRYTLSVVPTVAVSSDEEYVYTLMIRLDNTIRLWDEERIPFKDKDNWRVLRAIKKILSKYGGKEFIKAMDVNGNNLLVDVDERTIYLIDPYVPEDTTNHTVLSNSH